MAFQWRQLGAIAHIFVGIPTKTAESFDGGPANVVTVRSLTGKTIDATQLATVELPDRDTERYAIQPGDVLVSARSTTLKSAIVPKDLAGLVINATLLGIRTLPELEPRLLVAWLEHPEGRAALESVAQSGSVQMNITVGAISKIMIPVPPLQVQRQIVTILEAADEAYQAALLAAESRRQLAMHVAVQRLHNEEAQ